MRVILLGITSEYARYFGCLTFYTFFSVCILYTVPYILTIYSRRMLLHTVFCALKKGQYALHMFATPKRSVLALFLLCCTNNIQG
jgi:hypothetical protein